MKNCTFIPALLYCSVLVSGSQTVKVQPGDDVTLECRKNSSGLSYWFRLGEKNKADCICIMINNDPGSVKNCDGFQKEKFNMSSNSSTVSLKIKKVNISDAGLYFCGVKKDKSIAFNVIHLHVKGKKIFLNFSQILPTFPFLSANPFTVFYLKTQRCFMRMQRNKVRIFSNPLSILSEAILNNN
uniref:Ig-like domain-containing protein n=1 Tax=Poecilia latipinna TaxID=48699 RepID=A0A3B3VTP8_9TELE